MSTVTVEMIDAAMVEMASITPPLRRSECEQLIRAALAAAKAVSEDNRQPVTITSVKMVGGFAPEADLMRQAIAQLEGMGYRVEQAGAVSEVGINGLTEAETSATMSVMGLSKPQAQGEANNFPFYELKFIMRVLGHKGDAPKADWDTAYGMAREIFTRWHTATINPQAQGEAVDYDYQATFNAIAEAAKPSANGLAISVKKFWESYRASTHPQATKPQAQVEEETPEHEKCPYCGITCESPCDAPPPGPCEQACNAFYGSDPTKP